MLRIGHKGPSGAPVETDRFEICSPKEDAATGERPLHSAFERYNSLAPERRRAIRGNFIHRAEASAFQYHLAAQTLKANNQDERWATPPNRRPACTGDGKRATRYYGKKGDDDWREITSCGERCEFFGNRCKPFGRLYFRPRWPDDERWGPSCLMKLTTRSWFSLSSFQGFFDFFRDQCSALGIGGASIYALPFLLELGRKTQPKKKRSFPVLTLSPDGDILEFVAHQRSLLEGAGSETLRIAGAEDLEEQDAIDADYRDVTPRMPGR